MVVSVDDEKDHAQIPVVLSEYGIAPPYYVVRPPRGEFKRKVHPEWSGALPVSFLFDANARGRFFWDGPVTAPALRSILEQFIAEQAPDGDPPADGPELRDHAGERGDAQPHSTEHHVVEQSKRSLSGVIPSG
jgi:hypothetical protein